MSPEQALGEAIDQRSDLFSVGIVLYEMATGQRPFIGASDAAMYDALLHTSPAAPTTLRDGLPVEFDLVIGRALEKDRELRYQSAADLGADLKRLQRPPAFGSAAALRPVKRPRTRAWQTAAIAALLLIASALAIALVTRRSPSGAQTTRFVLGPPPNTVFTPVGLVPAAVTVSVSPDGRQLLYAANRPGEQRRLWLRSIDSVDAIPIDDTEGGIFPFWSPDGRSIGFATGGVLKRKDLAGGPSRTLVENVVVRGGAWNRDGVILYAAAAQGIFRVSADGGAPTAVTNPDVSRGESHTFPQFLPDGQHFLYLARSQGTPRVFVGSLDGRVSRHVLDTNARVSYADPGFLFIVGDDGALLARRFDASRLEITGEAMPVARRVAVSSVLDASFAVGGATLVYAEAIAGTSQLTWFDRSGRNDRHGRQRRPAYGCPPLAGWKLGRRRPDGPEREHAGPLADRFGSWCGVPVHLPSANRPVAGLVARQRARGVLVEVGREPAGIPGVRTGDRRWCRRAPAVQVRRFDAS